jgi:hypothetical protein
MLFIISKYKSSVFSNRVATDEENEDQILEQQNDNINSLEKSLKNKTSKFLKWRSCKIGKRERSFGLQRSAKSK